MQMLDSLHNSTVISFAVLSGRTAVWVSERPRSLLQLIEGIQTISVVLARNFRRLCADREANPTTLKTEGKKLYASLLAPVATHLSIDRT